MRLHGDYTLVTILDGDFSMGITEEGEYGSFLEVEKGEKYTGQTEVTPTEEEQTLRTRGMIVGEDITINAIPKNYGKITWDGTHLRVE